MVRVSKKTSQLLETQIIEWYNNHPDKLEEIILIINRKHPSISLRKLNYFITIFAQRYRTLVSINPGEYIDVYGAYKDALRCYHQSYFDMFHRVRKQKHQLTVSSKAYIENTPIENDDEQPPTTIEESPKFCRVKNKRVSPEYYKRPAVCQMNFFRWAYSLGIMDHIMANPHLMMQ